MGTYTFFSPYSSFVFFHSLRHIASRSDGLGLIYLPTDLHASIVSYIAFPTMKHAAQTNPHLKRPRGSDTGPDKATHSSDGQDKRCRLSTHSDNKTQSKQAIAASGAPEKSLAHVTQAADHSGGLGSAVWSLSNPLAGQYSNLDPALTLDEE